jgi:hypothetical protein
MDLSLLSIWSITSSFLLCTIDTEENLHTHMPTLDWIGKDAVVNHHKEVPRPDRRSRDLRSAVWARSKTFAQQSH